MVIPHQACRRTAVHRPRSGRTPTRHRCCGGRHRAHRTWDRRRPGGRRLRGQEERGSAQQLSDPAPSPAAHPRGAGAHHRRGPRRAHGWQHEAAIPETGLSLSCPRLILDPGSEIAGRTNALAAVPSRGQRRALAFSWASVRPLPGVPKSGGQTVDAHGLKRRRSLRRRCPAGGRWQRPGPGRSPPACGRWIACGS